MRGQVRLNLLSLCPWDSQWSCAHFSYFCRHFAIAEIKTFAVMLLIHATVEISEDSAWPEMLERVGTGVYQPKGDLSVIVRKRALH